MDTRVTLQGMVVTATWGSGLWVQSPEGGPLSGISVYTGERATEALGALVDIEGVVNEYFGDTQIADATVTAQGQSVEVEPLAVTVADAAGEPLEGVLVTLTDATVSDRMYDCSQDVEQCQDDGLWEVTGDDGSTILVFDRVYTGAEWAETIGQTPITGVMSFRFESRRILPRGPEDFGPR